VLCELLCEDMEYLGEFHTGIVSDLLFTFTVFLVRVPSFPKEDLIKYRPSILFRDLKKRSVKGR
jgi:hypothetical protein